VGAAQHQSAPAHVAAAYELNGEKKAVAEDVQQRFGIFRRRNAAQQEVSAVLTSVSIEQRGVAQERNEIRLVILLD